MLNLIYTNKNLLPADASLSTAMCGSTCQQKPVSQPFSRQVTEFFSKLFNTDDFPARWHCGRWTDFHGWLYILSDVGIAVAYFAIPFFLLRIVLRRKDVPFNSMVVFFIAFVSLCGLTHLTDAVIFWWPVYRLSAILRFATAIISLGAVYAVNQAFPVLLRLRSVKELKVEIEKRKKTEERLSASEFLLLEAGRIACVGGWEIDLVTHKRTWSKTIYDILEMPYDHDIYHQEHPLSYYPQPYRGLLDHAVEEAMQKGTKWDLEVLATTLKNKTLWVRHIGEPVFNAQGKLIKLRGTLMDIDQYKKHELELSRSLEVTMEQKQQLQSFAYVLSHHIRNHTSNLSALSAMIEVEGLDEDNKDLILKSKQVTQVLTTTLDELAGVIQAQDQIIHQDWVSFEDVANVAIESQSFQIEQAEAHVVKDFEVNKVCFSHLYINSVFQHLLSNAVKYRDTAKQLLIEFKTYRNDAGEVIFECKDNGLGIDLNVYGSKVFNLYATFHNPLSSRGVGLYLIKTQIESQGGKITVTSQPGVGSTFQITFRNN